MLLQIFLTLQMSIYCVLSDQRKDEWLCSMQQNCTSCLQTLDCIWCSDMSIQLIDRCVTRARYEWEGESWCANKLKVIKDASEINIFQNRALSSTTGSEPIQVQPQKLRLQLRIGQEQRINLKYSQAEDYPVDLYYLMDLSASMKVYKDDLSKLGFQIADAMKKLTSNFRLGFGSFVDKVVLPMTPTQQELSSCNLVSKSNESCDIPYGYKNQMSLTRDISLFKTRVEQAIISGNLDAPEGGLDAMLQVMVCTKEIGWRPKARRLIVFSTDANYHIAGDGKLAGIVEPNDGLCHLDNNGYYNYSVLQDYPSISQINKIAHENNINIIFAVPPHENSAYQLLSQSITGSSIGLLKSDSQNVAVLISNEYEKLVDSVKMTDNGTKTIDIKYFSRCRNETAELKEIRECGDLRVGNIVEFELVIKALNCPGNPGEWQQTIQVKPSGLNESLTVDVQLICDCSCGETNHSNNTINETCRGNGNLVCGVCNCNEDFYGQFCECKRNTYKNDEPVKEDCSPTGEKKICSGRGTCKCGACSCTKRANPKEIFYGKYCECDNFSCKRNSEKLVCGGRGKCECGTCNCFPGWTGETCDCKETNTTCMPTEDTNKICSDHGDCVCGRCHCYQNGYIRYTGKFCEDCPTCPDKLCKDFKDYIECEVHNSGPFLVNGHCKDNVADVLRIYDVENVQEEPSDNETGAHICRVPGDGGCTFVFKYKLYRGGVGGDIKMYEIYAEKSRECPEPVNAMGVAIGVVVSTVILGLFVLLVWRVLTEVHDRREYARFVKEREEAKWHPNENPLYIQATTTFDNPTFSSLINKDSYYSDD